MSQEDPNNNEKPNAASAKVTSFTDMFNHGADLSKSRAASLTSGILGKSWKDVGEEDIQLDVVKGGFVNRIFSCRHIRTNEVVLIRLYGGKMIEQDNIIRSIGLEGEVLIFHLMSRAGIGPKLLGVFDGGRIEEFIHDGNIISNDDINDPRVMNAFAKKLAQIHSIEEAPFLRKPKDFIGMTREIFTEKWESYLASTSTYPDPEIAEMKKAIEVGIEYDWLGLVDWFESVFPRIRHRVVFGHGDMNRSNCLIRKTGDSVEAVMLDFEMCGYIYRGCDIGHHFKNRCIDVGKFVNLASNDDNSSPDEKHDVFMSETMSIPYPEEDGPVGRRAFIETYLEEVKRLKEKATGEEAFDPEGVDSVDNVLLEAEFFGGLYDLFFTSWIVKDHDKWREIDFPGHPGIWLGMAVKGMEETRTNVLQLLDRVNKG